MMITGHGGKRPGAGRPKGSATTASQEFSQAKADHQRARADLAMMELRRRRGELCEAAEVERVVSTAFAAIRQSILGIPDRLEREASNGPEIAEAVERQLHAELQVLADSLSTLGMEKPQNKPAKKSNRRAAA